MQLVTSAKNIIVGLIHSFEKDIFRLWYILTLEAEDLPLYKVDFAFMEITFWWNKCGVDIM